MAQSLFLIDGMTCEHCEHAIHAAITPLSGVTGVQVSASEGVATVEHDDRLDAVEVAAAVTDAGYAVRV